jgi:hypothetical protein
MGFADEILVRLGLDQTTLGRGLAASKAQITEFAHSTREGFNDIMKELAAPLTGVGLIAGVERVFGKVDEIERTAAATGLSAEAFQRLSYAAKQVGIDSDAMEKSLDFLAKTLGEAGGTGPEAHEAAQKFAEFGIAIRDSSGHLRSTSDLLDEISNKMAAMTDPAQKAEMAMELLGKSGQKLIAILGEGSSSLHDRGKGAAIFSEEDIENIKRAHTEVESVTNTLTVWLGKSISAVGKVAGFAGGMFTDKHWGLAEGFKSQDDALTVETSKRIVEMKKATQDRIAYEQKQREAMEDQLHRIAERHRADRAEEDKKDLEAEEKQLTAIAKRHREDRRQEIQDEYLQRRREETALAIEVKKNSSYYSTVHELAQNQSWGWAYQTARDIEYREGQLRQYVMNNGARGQEFVQYRDQTQALKDQLEAAGYISPEQTMQRMNDHLANILSRLDTTGGLPVSVAIQ